MISTDMTVPHPFQNVIPGSRRRWMPQKIGASSRQFFTLPVMQRHRFGSRGKVVPQILDELELLSGT